MKLRKMKLVALALSAAMVMSAMSPVAFAEEEIVISDEATAEEVAANDGVAVASEAQPVVGEMVPVPVAESTPIEPNDYVVDEDSIKFYYDEEGHEDYSVEYKVTWTDSLGEHTETRKVLNVTHSTVAATCQHGTIIRMTATIPELVDKEVEGKKGVRYSEIILDDKKDHTYVTKTEVVTQPDCLNGRDGVAKETRTCSVCGEADPAFTSNENVPIPWEHTSPATVEYELGTNTKLGADGKPTLVDPTHSGQYKTKFVCTVCKKTVTSNEWTRIPATTAAKVVVLNTGSDNIDEGYLATLAQQFASSDHQTLSDLPANDKVVLKDCTKDGYYIVELRDADGVTIDKSYKWKVTAHHTVKDTVFNVDTAKYGKIWMTDSEGKPVNLSCSESITYVEEIHCANKNCKNTKSTIDHDPIISKATKTLAPNDDRHIFNEFKKVVEKQIETKTQWERNDENNKLYAYADKASLQRAIDANEAYKVGVKIISDGSTCTEEGLVVIEYTCLNCKKGTTTTQVMVGPSGHKKPENYEVETIVPPTCTAEGKADLVKECENGCGYVFDKQEGVVLPKLKHTYELNDKAPVKVDIVGNVVVGNVSASEVTGANNKNVVTIDSVNFTAGEYSVDPTMGVQVKATVACENCGTVATKTIKDCDLKVVSHTNQEKNCKPGSITLTATAKVTENGADKIYTVTKTFDFYSSVYGYTSRTAHKWGDPVVEVVKKATAEEDGLKRTTVKCEVCGTVDTKEEVIPKLTPVTKLPKVTGLKAEVVGNGKVKLTWNAVEGADAYAVIGLNANGSSQIGATVSTTWTDAAASTEAFNYYWVIAIDIDEKTEEGTAGEFDSTNYVWALPRVIGKVAKVNAQAGKNGVALDWELVDGANKYVVLSRVGDPKAASKTVTVNGTSYVDKSAKAGEVVYYWVYGVYENADGAKCAAGATSPYAWAVAQ